MYNIMYQVIACVIYGLFCLPHWSVNIIGRSRNLFRSLKPRVELACHRYYCGRRHDRQEAWVQIQRGSGARPGQDSSKDLP